ncbi:LysR family transcriptional regulator [Dyella sp. LX-66]|uniref:LysR family transcriptional regulator n=1 Tax=unclassified Dyella TaxID=2634549 RepID=UPI001BE0D6EF|nr:MULTISPECIES: LysR family transcriptional regulator [unclassified Dyella]MBT2118537.1 LysR family transcriptional regulator [Dyella sp. LX-1]MBT2142008.1 LysR family transcriptional regulator [Dyella sp. LX-66]
MLDLTRLRLFRELARRGTMTAVAETFGMTSSAVSQHLATLERESGMRLLERVGRRVQLTPEGLRLAAHAEAILRTVELAEIDLRGADSPGGSLQIATFSTYARQRLLPAIARMRQRSPGLRVVIHELEPADSVAAVRRGDCQLALSFTYSLAPRAIDEDLMVLPVAEEPIVLALPPAWRKQRGAIDLRKLAGEEWIVGSRGSDDVQLAERACALAGFAPRITHRVDDYGLLLDMVAEGFGVGFVPELALGTAKAKVAVRAPRQMVLRGQIQLVTRAGLAASPLLRALLAELRTRRRLG